MVGNDQVPSGGIERGEKREDLNVFASRRGNWEVMARGGYYAKSLRNALNPGGRTAETVHGPSGDRMLVWDAAQRYRRDGDSVVVIAGDRYGMGSSRDWAAKVQRLLGVRAVLASSYERIHRSNLIGMGIMPLVVPEEYRDALAGLRAGDVVSIAAEADRVTTGARIPVTVRRSEGADFSFEATAAIQTDVESGLLRAGGVIPSILASTTKD